MAVRPSPPIRTEHFKSLTFNVVEMTKTTLHLIGYLISFLMGCMFTVSYVDMKVNDTLKPIKSESVIAAEEVVKAQKVTLLKEVKPWQKFKDTFELSIQLPEVTIIGSKHVSTVSKGICTTIEQKKSTFNKELYKSPTLTVRKEPITQNVVRIIKIYKLTPISLTASVEAKARSPGLVSIDNGANVNTLNSYQMLRKDKQYVKNILKLLFAGNKHFRIKEDGTIIIKKHWYSQRKIVTSITELLNYTIPKVMIALSKDLAEDYQIAVIDLRNKSDKIPTAFEFFSNFCTETGFLGKSLDFDFEPGIIKRKVIRTNLIITGKIDSLKQKSLSSLLIKIFPNFFENKEIKTIKALPSRSISSLKEILNKDLEFLNIQYRRVGLCMPGTLPENDTGMVGVYRLVEKEDLI